MQNARLRVALYGNMCNFLYQIAKSLRADAEAGIDAHLYIERSTDLQNRPESDDPELANGYPDWIHVGDWMHGPRRMLGVALPAALPVLAEWRRFDLLVVSAEGPSAARFARRPYVFISGGGDLTLMPFAERSAALDDAPGFVKRVGWRLRAHWQRRGIAAADMIATQPFAPFVEALRELAIPAQRVADTTSLLTLDMDRFRALQPQEVAALDLPIEALRDSDFVVFHPSRLMIRDSAVLRSTGQWKANDELIRGFAQFVARGAAKRPLLALIERSHSPDVALAKSLIAELGIESHVAWLRGRSGEGFTRHELLGLYAASHVTADDFGAGWFGSIVLEACACERPVLTYVDEGAMARMYPWHPFVNAHTPGEIADALGRLHASPAERAAIGSRGRAWVAEFHATGRRNDGLRQELLGLAQRLRTAHS